MAKIEREALLRQTEAWIRAATEGADAARTSAEDNKGARRHEQQEVPHGQARLPGRLEVHSTCSLEAHGEHANVSISHPHCSCRLSQVTLNGVQALGASAQRERALPHHRSHHVR